jgi:hypothetical protein
MPAFSVPVASACISVLYLIGTLPAQTPNETASPVQVSQPAQGSQVRIVRLSQVKGAVQLDRNTGRGYEPAIPNLPIVEHSRLETGMGVAEVEFEDNSTLRIAPGSTVEFTQLGRLPQGTTISSVRLVKGTAYVSLLKSRGNEFDLLFGQQKLELPPASHVRLQSDGSLATLAVLDGTVHLDESTGPTDVSHKNTVTFHLGDGAEPTVAKNIVPAAMDAWDKSAVETHAQAAATIAFGSPYAYGLGDMMYYGAFANVAGCGSMWRPYFASAAWDPYSNGVWAWYQGAGYSWVSPYPWGWTPYHFGNWSYCSGAGWGWQPGGSWNGLNNATAFGSTGGGGVGGAANPNPTHRIPRPVRPPAPGAPTLTAVNLKPLVHSGASANSFTFRTDSAGLGIPRDGLGKLNKLSQDTLTRGTASTPIYFSRPSSPEGYGRPERGSNGAPESNGNVAVTSMHRGSAPAPETQRPSESGSWGNGGRNASSGSSQQSSGQSSRSYEPPSSQPSRSYEPPSSQPSRSYEPTSRPSAPSPPPAPSAPPASSPPASSGASRPR